MNRSQRRVIFVGSLLITAMLLFPPMRPGRFRYGFVLSQRAAYFADLDTHDGRDAPFNGWVFWHLDQERLVFQLLIVAVLTGGIAAMLGGKRE